MDKQDSYNKKEVDEPIDEDLFSYVKSIAKEKSLLLQNKESIGTTDKESKKEVKNEPKDDEIYLGTKKSS